MVDVTLFGNGRQGVEHLVHAGHGQCRHVHHLCFATLEQTRTVSGAQDANFGSHCTKIARSATVDTNTVFNDALTNQLLGEAAHCFFDFFVASSKRCVC